MNGIPTHRPLTELGPTSQRRNSPSYNQATRVEFKKQRDSENVLTISRRASSPTRFNESRSQVGDRDASPSPAKRSSIENLKRASRVKNSNMFAREHNQEYDPASSPMIERPLATGRPLTTQIQGNAYGGRGIEGFRQSINAEKKNTPVTSPLRSPLKMSGMSEMSNSPLKGQTSPPKSSLSSRSRYAQAHQAFDPENGIWSDDEDSPAERELPPGKSLHRHAKSVTFDVAPPQINEYEMTTPDPSSVASGSREGSYESGDNEEDESFARGSSIDREDSFDASLEDTEKTPVVLPEDWRFMSPELASNELTARVEDPFDGEHNSPAPTAQPSSAVDARSSPTRTDSANSNGERRPLPPLPALGMPVFPRARSDSHDSLSATAERVSNTQRAVPSPPRPAPASISKSEIQGMGGCSMSLEERLRLMMIQDEEKPQTVAEEQQEQRERRLRRGSPVREPGSDADNRVVQMHEEEVENDDVADLGEYKMPPRISRESILRKVKSRNFNEPEDDHSSLALSPSSGKDGFENLDPDVPIPSLETEALGKDVIIKQEPIDDDSELDVYTIPDLYSQQLEAESYMNAIEKLEAIQKSRDAAKDDDDESHYSVDSKEDGGHGAPSSSAPDDDGPPTPRATTSNQTERLVERKSSHRMSLPQFAALLGESDFGFDMESFLAPSPLVSQEPEKSAVMSKHSWTPSPPPVQEAVSSTQTTESTIVDKPLSRPMTPEAQLEPPRIPGQWNDSVNDPQTPESVIRHPIAEPPIPDSPEVPAPVATIKAPGAKLKTRPSLTPSDVHAMAEVRRQVSNGSEVPMVPKIAERYLSRPSVVGEEGESVLEPAGEMTSTESTAKHEGSKRTQRKSSLLPLEVPVEDADGLGIEGEFDRLLEAQKVAFNLPFPLEMAAQARSTGCAEYIAGQGFQSIGGSCANKTFRTQKGYLMRQNTKVIIASSASHESAESTTETKDLKEPGARGTRSAGSSPRKASNMTTEPWNGKIRRKSLRKSGGVPSKAPPSGPAPPMPGQQSNVASSLDSVDENAAMEATEEIGEDGERAWLELGKTAPIGQEFELVVLNDLEFQLTLQTKLEEPKAKPIIESPTKTPKTTKQSTFSRVFASPRKRKELEMKQQEEAKQAERQKQQEVAARRRTAQPTAWDLLHMLVAKDGSFARSYVCLKDHESSAYGKPFTVDVPCFNEWATEESYNGSSVKSKRSAVNGGVQRKAPYKVGKLELQLLFVPKPNGAKDEDMPKSMNACIRELKEAETKAPTKWEGHLSQQGGDCPYWRRRFFTLDGPKFTAYHEATRQPRATINLAKASKLIDDKNSLMRNDASPKKGGRRKSAFAEEEDGYMFVEEGFRMRFANGETIDFYADSAAEKDGWMKVLAEVVGKDTTKPKSWTDLVMAKQRATASKAAQAQHSPIKGHSAKQAPPTPSKHAPHSSAPPMPEKSPRRSNADQIAQRREAVKTRSMIF
ncbi:hypothetical protein P7C71_g3343, partial [Lecanoromycetidae sp. Uapishka_2]